jgi:hypothetical protein
LNSYKNNILSKYNYKYKIRKYNTLNFIRLKNKFNTKKSLIKLNDSQIMRCLSNFKQKLSYLQQRNYTAYTQIPKYVIINSHIVPIHLNTAGFFYVIATKAIRLLLKNADINIPKILITAIGG